jgi:mono/diheme cytochrome c family protein
MPIMPTPAHPSLKARKLFLILLLILVALSVFLALRDRGPWIVPEAEKSRRNPVNPSSASLEEIKPIYHEDCAKCHGETGKGDGSKATQYRPPPTDFTDAAHLATRTDGELFYKLSEGRRPMPGFKGRLTEDQRWRLVLLIRSFAKPLSTPAVK